MKRILFTLFLFKTMVSYSQDTLKIFEKSYILERSGGIYSNIENCNPINAHYFEYKEHLHKYSITSSNNCNCFDEILGIEDPIWGIFFLEYKCPKKEETNFAYYSVLDRLPISVLDVKQRPFIKTVDGENNITGVRLKLVMKHEVKLIAFEFDSKYEDLNSLIRSRIENEDEIKYLIIERIYYSKNRDTKYELPGEIILYN